ncbi:hypothetical protein, partial [Novosphingobium naphthalenivorans]|uniref:hypothetical protein n=1 Tax=Novosphingobium naphthalenivorans TaxID=273168 RepID=UPI001C3F25C4
MTTIADMVDLKPIGAAEPSATAVEADLPIYSGDLSALNVETEYRSLKDDPVERFYKPCLRNSNFYRRAVGYFRSTVFVVVGTSMVDFAKRGGKIHLICSPHLADDDVEQIVQGYAHREQTVTDDLIAQFDALIAHPETTLGARTL